MSRDPLQISPEALFRYQWVAEVDARVLGGEKLKEVIRSIRRRPRLAPHGRERLPSKRSLYRWYAAFGERGIAGLEPLRRPPFASSLKPELLDLLREKKIADPELSVPDLIQIARTMGVIGSQEKISRTTVWRACRRMGLPLRRRDCIELADTRRFAYPRRMMMVLSDGKHFRAGTKRRRRVALSFLDDATRYGLGIIVGTAESTVLFLHGLYKVILRYGLMNLLYLDHGPGFISDDTGTVIARLKRHLVHGRVRYPEGHGKIERYNRTLKHKALRNLDGRPEVDPDCSALTLRLTHWLREQYNHTPHESLGGMTPSERWLQDERDLVLPEDRAWLDAQFLITEQRTVSKDHVVSIDGVLYEVPSACRGRIAITRHLLSDRRTVRLEERDVAIHPLDLTHNALDRRAHRDKPSQASIQPTTPASEAFEDDFGPIVDPDGNYHDPEEEP
ncbi:MAG: transposase [Pseudoalteromonas sp.]|nr:transposase [Pseudoalteromonas sp.]